MIPTEIEDLLIRMGASPFDLFFVVVMGVVLYFVWKIRKRDLYLYKCLEKKYNLLNTNHIALWMVVAPASVKWHHSGEYHIDIKSLVDLAEKMNREAE